MPHNKITSYNVKLEKMYFDELNDRRRKIQQEQKDLESNKLTQYNEMARINRNRLYYEQYKNMELYEFQQRTLKLQADKRIQVGINVDSYT